MLDTRTQTHAVPDATTRRRPLTRADKDELVRLQSLGVIESVVVGGRLRWRTTGVDEASVVIRPRIQR